MPYTSCKLCGRLCGVDRTSSEVGFCKMSAAPSVSRAALHFWEEPVISGTSGSGAIFFTGCSLGCVFCQNRAISGGESGLEITEIRIAEIMSELELHGAHNINFVTPTHFAPSVVTSTRFAREAGLSIPIVYNTGGYDSPDTVDMLDGTVDVYLPDFKYYLSRTAAKYSRAGDYPEIARAAIDKMVRQRGAAVIENGLMKSGVLVRILLLPSHLAEAKLSVGYLLDTYGDDIYISLMNQYTPIGKMKAPLDRRVTHAEYEELVDYAVRKGLKNGFIQGGGSADESFIPPFDNTGVLL